VNRRQFLAAGLMVTPIAAMLTACGSKGDWPEDMVEIKWDRDTCMRCNMVISDRRFAVEMRGGEKNIVFKFDDIGCLVFWLRDKAKIFPWIVDPATHLWVADSASKGERWLDPRQAHYVGGSHVSPMGYNYAAIAHPQHGSIDFTALRGQVLALGK
jgi:copper chaperone NosL